MEEKEQIKLDTKNPKDCLVILQFLVDNVNMAGFNGIQVKGFYEAIETLNKTIKENKDE